MTIDLSCPQCGKRIQTADSNAGKKGRCPQCQAVFSIPEREAGERPLPGPPPEGGSAEPFAADQTVSWEVSKELLSDLAAPSRAGEETPLNPPAAPAGQGDEDLFSPGSSSSPGTPPHNPLGEYDPLAAAATDEQFAPSGYAPAPYNPPAYAPYPPSQPAYGASYVSQSTYGLKPHRGGLSLTFGIISISCGVASMPACACCPWWSFVGLVAMFLALGFGIPAVIIAPLDNSQISAGLRDPAGRGMNTTGLILGIVGLCLVPVAGIVGLIKTAVTGGVY